MGSGGLEKLREPRAEGGLKDRESNSRETSLAAAAFKALSSVWPIVEGGGGVGGVTALGGSSCACCGGPATKKQG